MQAGALYASNTKPHVGRAMIRSAADGARLALMVGVSLTIVNGLWARFSPSSRTLSDTVSDVVGGV